MAFQYVPTKEEKDLKAQHIKLMEEFREEWLKERRRSDNSLASVGAVFMMLLKRGLIR